MPTRYTITFTGRVQGVGFRATTESVAEGFTITGWVRNQRDGSVLCIAEGQRAELDRFIQAIERAMAGCIDHKDVQESPASGEFTGFEVRH